MHRLTSALLLGGVVLLTSYINSPAAPSLAPERVSADDLAAIDAMRPLADDVAQETERLRARLATAPEAPVARRDPFNFGASTRPAKSAPVQTPELAPVVDAAPVIVWPKLVALLTDRGETAALSAVLAFDDAVEILTVGATVGGFLIRGVTSRSVELVHVATSAVTTLLIR
jgi:hypothetical protein